MKNKKNILPRLAICLCIFVTGCSTTENIRLLLPEKRSELLSSSNTIVKGTIIDNGNTADLTLGENLQFGVPAYPKNGYKLDFTINVSSVVKGNFSGGVLRLSNLKDPTQTGLPSPKLWLGPHQIVYVGWQKESFGNYQGLMMVNAKIVWPTTTSP